MEDKQRMAGVRLATPSQVRRHLARLNNAVRRAEVTETNAMTQVSICKCILDSIKMQSANQNELAEMDEA